MTTPNPVDAAIQAAEQQAKQAPAQTASVPAVSQAPQQTAVAAYTPVKPPSLADLSSGSMNVDDFLKVNENGLKIGAKVNLIEKIKVKIDLTEVVPFNGIRYGNPPTYAKSYDGVTCASGGTWNEAVAKANLVDPKARPYNGADISMALLEDAKDIKGVVVAEAGLRLGHSTSITNRAEIASFLKEVDKAGLTGGVVEAEVSYKPMTNKNSQTWGIITIALLGASQGE